MGRTEDRQAGDLATVDQFANDERRLDGLADADVVGNQQAHDFLLECHQQRHELVGARLDGDVAEAAKRAGASAQLELQRVAQQLPGGVVGSLGDGRPGDCCLLYTSRCV